MYGWVEGLFGQTVVLKRSSVLSLQSRVPLVLFPRHPLHTGKYRVTLLPLCFLCATRQSTGLWFAAKKTADSGLVCCPSCHSQPPFIGSRAHCLFSLHCWERRTGGTLVLPVGESCGVHAKETFPSAHSELASAPLAKTSQLKDAGFRLKLFFPWTHREVWTAIGELQKHDGSKWRSEYPSWTLDLYWTRTANRVELLTQR